MHKRRTRCVIAAAIILITGGAMARQQSNQTRRIPQFENDEVKVWKSIILPKQPLAMHRHDHPRVIVALVGGTLKVVKQSGDAHLLAWETGKAYWLDADPPGELHADVNEAERPIEVMVVELKKAK